MTKTRVIGHFVAGNRMVAQSDIRLNFPAHPADTSVIGP
jgi:hypothetical protein